MSDGLAALAPTRKSERIEVLDVLRGFAILGILLVNFTGPVSENFEYWDRLVSRGLDFLVLSSFYPLFSFLFGLGFALQLQRARRRAQPIVDLYLRRLAILFLIGTAHSVLVWNGDILVDYALFGLALILLHRLPLRAIAVLIVLLIGFHVESERVPGWIAAIREVPTEELQAQELVRGMREEEMTIRNNRWARSERSFVMDVSRRWYGYSARVARFADWKYVLGRDVLFLFLLGFYVGRKRWLEQGTERRHALKVTAAAGVAAAVVGGLYGYFVDGGPVEMRVLGRMLSNYGVTAFYVGAIAVAVAGGGLIARRLRAFIPVGRTALTNYLAQSVVMTWLFLPYGLDRARPSASIFLLISITFFFLVQIPLSRWWLEEFRFGPMEWLWRSLTYGSIQPLRRERPAVAEVAGPEVGSVSVGGGRV